MKVFISQPMSGLPAEEIRQERQRIINIVGNLYPRKDIEIIDSYFEDFSGEPLEYLGKAISMMSDADLVVMGRNWGNSRGCRAEHWCAKEYGKQIIEL